MNKGWFKVFSDVFNVAISYHAKLVYNYLCRCANKDASCFPSVGTIAVACSCGRTTVKKALAELVRQNLLIKHERYAQNGRQTSNLYTIVKNDESQWFVSYNMIFDMPLSAHARIVYQYIRKCSGKNGESFSSVGEISRACGNSKSSVNRALTELDRANLIEAEARYTDDGRQISNIYRLCEPCTEQPDGPQDNGDSSNTSFCAVSSVTPHPVTNDHLEVLPKLSLYFLKNKIKSLLNLHSIYNALIFQKKSAKELLCETDIFKY